MEDQEERVLRALTLLVAACEQAALELDMLGSTDPLVRRLDDTHDLAIDWVRSHLPGADVP